jgi:anaerobic selenocysteine-containing dehydrogenase
MVVTVDEQEQIVAIRPDREDPISKGFACYKGLQAPEAHHAEHRVLHPLKRRADGSFERIGLEQALDEIAAKVREIVDRDGPEAIAGYRGTGSGMNASGCFSLDGLLNPLGTPKIFSATTIDQSCKIIAMGRIGFWPPGPHPLRGSDAVLLIGTNPLVSLVFFEPQKMLQHLKGELARGMKLLMIDPRRSETGRFADILLQPLPGEDATILAGMIRYILERGWEDKEFIQRHVTQIEELRRAVEPFTPDYVARRADVPVDRFLALTETFAKAKRGRAESGTGAGMGPHSNLVGHLVLALNVICGRFIREGEKITNPGVLWPRMARPCQVIPGGRGWDKGYKSRIGYGQIPIVVPELPTGIMADEILQPGPGQVKGFFVHGGNPAVIVPDQLKMVRAFRSLELLVTVEPFMTATARVSHYVLPTVMQYERPDFPCWQVENLTYAVPYTRYTQAVAKPPPGSEVATDNYIFWSLCKRLGLQMSFLGQAIDMSHPPDTDDFLEIVARNAPVSFDEIKSKELGGVFEGEPQFAEPGNPGPDDRFTVAPPDVCEDLAELAAESVQRNVITCDGGRATHIFAVRRHRDMWNSIGRELKGIKRRLPHNTARINPADLSVLGMRTGDRARISSERASVDVIIEADDSLRSGVVSMHHGFGTLPEDTDPRRDGACSNKLVSTERNIQKINAMPCMTAFPVHVAKIEDSRVQAGEAPALIASATA